MRGISRREEAQLSTGILSYGRMGAPHFGHADAGITIDFRCGMRMMQTFRKLPINSPKMNTNMPMIGAGSTL